MADDVIAASSLPLAEAPSAAMGMTYLANAQSIGLIMQNAALAQKLMQQTAGTATAVVCALIIAKGSQPTS